VQPIAGRICCLLSNRAALLQEFGRLSNVELAKAVNLSPTPCLSTRESWTPA
jgi:hypothetical protein